MFCPRCGTQLDNNVRFCGGCGYKFENTPSAAPVQPAQVTPPPAPVQQPSPVQQIPQAQAKKPNSVAVFLVTFLVLGAITAAIMLFVYPGWLNSADDDDDDDSSSKRAKDSSSVSQTDSDSSDDESSDDDSSQEETTTTTTTTAPAETEPPETTTTTAETPPDTQTTTSAAPSGGNVDDDFTEAMNFSTNVAPTFDEFDWCYGQSDVVKSAPSSAQKLTNSSSIAGGWKSMFIYYSADNNDVLARELNNITIDVKDNNVTATVTWHYMEFADSESQSEDDLDPESFDAVFSSGVLKGDFYGSDLTITEFWKENGKEYAVGEYDMSANGVYVYIALVR